MSSHAARMLLDLSQTQTGRTGNNNGAAVKCPVLQGYRTCLPSQNGGGPNNRCGTYNRVCKEYYILISFSLIQDIGIILDMFPYLCLYICDCVMKF